MNVRQFQAFTKIADNHSFSRTAAELHLAQPTVSACIAGFEGELGVRLFVRTTKSVELTKEGEKLLPYARELLGLAEEIQDLFREGTVIGRCTC